jgi:hypothetical protein
MSFFSCAVALFSVNFIGIASVPSLVMFKGMEKEFLGGNRKKLLTVGHSGKVIGNTKIFTCESYRKSVKRRIQN